MLVNKDLLIAKYLSGNITADEEKALLDWAQKHEDHNQELHKAKQIWDLTASLRKNEEADTEKAWAEFQVLKEQPFHKSLAKPFLSPLKIAACIIILMMIGFISTLILFKTNGSGPDHPVIASKPINHALITIYTGDSARVFFLPDSSRVFLNANSSLRYPEQFNENRRNTFLNGEAFFEVRRDATKPFFVFCGETQTKVLGTSFNIKGYKHQQTVEVIVVTGRVEVSNIRKPEASKMILLPQDKVIFDSKQASFTKTKTTEKDRKWHEKNSLGKRIKKMIQKLKHKLK